AGPPASQPPRRHLGASGQVPRAAGLRLGNAHPVRQHAHSGQGARGLVGRVGRPAVRDADPGVHGPAAERHRQGEMALQERRAGVRARVKDREGALEGVVVIELARTLAGEFAGGLLADLGAIVIKVEPPDGSPLRRRGPGIAGEDSLYFQSENRGKYSVLAELGELGREPWLAKLLATADAVIEDLGPRRPEAIGLPQAALSALNARTTLPRRN